MYYSYVYLTFVALQKAFKRLVCVYGQMNTKNIHINSYWILLYFKEKEEYTMTVKGLK